MKRALAAVAFLLLLPPATARAAAGPPIAALQQTAALLTTHTVSERPAADAVPIGSVGAGRPITGERTVLPVLAQATDAAGVSWLEVRLPGRALRAKATPPTGWINAVHTVRSATAWHIVVDLYSRRVVAYRNGRPLASFGAVIGKPSTPTPVGEYFVEENVLLRRGDVGGPFALATSARSNVLQEFDGGPGQIALHGRDAVGGQIGSAVSHGCIRLADPAIAWLAARITPGVPVTIV